MKRKLVLMVILALIITAIPVSAQDEHWLYKDNIEEMQEVIESLRNFGGSALPYDPLEITQKHLIRIHKFNDMNLPNVYNEKGSIADNINSEYKYKFQNEVSGFAVYVRKQEDGSWEATGGSSDRLTTEKEFPDISFLFIDMVEKIEDKFPDFDRGSLRYIEYHELSADLIFFISDDVEYIAYYPFSSESGGGELFCGEIYTVEEYINHIKDYPIFNITEIKPGTYGGGVGTAKKSIPIFVYPLSAAVIICAVVSVVLVVRNKRKNRKLYFDR